MAEKLAVIEIGWDTDDQTLEQIREAVNEACVVLLKKIPGDGLTISGVIHTTLEDYIEQLIKLREIRAGKENTE